MTFVAFGPTLKSTVARMVPCVLFVDLTHLNDGNGAFFKRKKTMEEKTSENRTYIIDGHEETSHGEKHTNFMTST